MKTVMSLLIVLAGSSAFADYGYTTSMTCRQARHIVNTQGAVVLYTSADIYDRYVNGSGQCLAGEYADPAWITTADSTACFVGYTCKGGNPNGGGGN